MSDPDEQLKVEIPYRFKEGFEERYSVSALVKMGYCHGNIIRVPCHLCAEYLTDKNCNGCPFACFENSDFPMNRKLPRRKGCVRWADFVLGHHAEFYTYQSYISFSSKEGIVDYLTLIERAKGLITWVKTGPVGVDGIPGIPGPPKVEAKVEPEIEITRHGRYFGAGYLCCCRCPECRFVCFPILNAERTDSEYDCTHCGCEFNFSKKIKSFGGKK